METLETVVEVPECSLCHKREEDLSLYMAQHKDLGWIKVCRVCWVKLYDENSIVAGSGGSSGSACPTCGL